MFPLDQLLAALTLQAGYNSALVAVGAALLGFAGGGVGSFLFLRKRALVCDAIAHATLPGVGLAFIVMVALGGNGRYLPGLLLGSVASAWAGLLLVEWIARRTRLGEDASIGAVLSVFFGFGIVLLTVIQNLPAGRQAGLETFLLGSTAGMLFQEALTIAVAGAAAVALVVLLRRPMTLVAFDPDYATATGTSVTRIDLAMMSLALMVTVIGLKVVGLVLVVALLIIPPVAARFWTERADRLILIAALIGAAAGYLGGAISATAAKLPTGPIVVLVALAAFLISMFLAPSRGIVASVLRYARFQRRVHVRQGLLALARAEPIFDDLTLRLLRRAGYVRPDGVATLEGRAAAAKALRDEVRWERARRIYQEEAVVGRYDGLTPIETVLTADEIAELDRQIGRPAEVPA